VGRTTEERLRADLNRQRELAGYLAAERDQAKAEARGQKAAKTRIKNDRDRIRDRVGAGVCPCCNRTFKQLARHMQAKHPDYPGAEEGNPR
jgi:Asp-tRNA(Asn)/Glu-tRNA(Gln) amidotransferase A subunit family amidase